jgi:hypothetical protein
MERKDRRVTVCFDLETYNRLEWLRGNVPRSAFIKIKLKRVLRA